MKTSVLEVRDMLSILSVAGVEKRIRDVPGVASATVNFAGGSATVRYDETRLDVHDIKSAVRQSAIEAEAQSSVNPLSEPSAASADSAAGAHEKAEVPPQPASSVAVAPTATASTKGDPPALPGRQ